MSIASEITALNTNLQAAKNAVVAKGGTVGDTGLAGLASEIGTISGGGEEYVAPYGNLEYDGESRDWVVLNADCYDGYIDESTMRIANYQLWFEWMDNAHHLSDMYHDYAFSWASESEGGTVEWTVVWTNEYGDQQTETLSGCTTEEDLEATTGIHIDWIVDEEGGEERKRCDFTVEDHIELLNGQKGGIKYLYSPLDFYNLWNPGVDDITGNQTYLGIDATLITKYTFGPDTPDTIPRGFLASCGNLEYIDLSRATNVTTIGSHFCEYMNKLKGPIEIPSSVTSIGSHFLNNASDFTGPLIVNTAHSPTDNNSLSTAYSYAGMYATGVTIKGSGRSSWLTNLPNKDSIPYRKLIDGGA